MVALLQPLVLPHLLLLFFPFMFSHSPAILKQPTSQMNGSAHCKPEGRRRLVSTCRCPFHSPM